MHAANIHDTVAGCFTFNQALDKYPSLKGLCADSGYRGTMQNFVENTLKKSISISKRIVSGWVVLARRWVVERTFAWLNHSRRLSKDYEIATSSAENMIMISHSAVLLRRLFKS